MRRLGGEVWQRASGITADAGASGLVDRPSRRAPESSEGRDARREDLVAWPAGLDVAGRGLARGQTLRKSMWVMVSPPVGDAGGSWVSDTIIPHPPARGCRCVPSQLARWHRSHRVSAGY